MPEFAHNFAIFSIAWENSLEDSDPIEKYT